MENKSSIKNNQEEQTLKRGLNQRHIQLIAIGGAIGTGLFMGSAKTIHLAGPSIIFVYIIIGAFLYFVMRAMGEVLLSNLSYKSFTDMVSDVVGPRAGFFIGWTYWFCWIVTGTSDIIAIAGYFHFWFPDTSIWIPSFLFVFLIICLNLFSVKLFGEMEFWFASIKIIAIMLIIFISIIMVTIGFEYNGYVSSFSNLWKYGGFFPKDILSFFAGFQIVIFAFVGIELIGTTAAEAESPEINIPKAINTIPFRIVFFYVFSLIAIMSITPWNSLDPEVSPFVSSFMAVGIPAAASIVNFVVLTSAASSTNSGIYSTSRMVYGLSLAGLAPKAFRKLSTRHVPVNGLLFSCLCLFIGTIVLTLSDSIMAAFTIMTTISAVCFIIVWSIILLSYYVYRKKYPEKHKNSKFKLPGGLVSVWACWIFFGFILILLTLEKDTRMAMIATPVWFVLLYIGYVMNSRYRLKVNNKDK